MVFSTLSRSCSENECVKSLDELYPRIWATTSNTGPIYNKKNNFNNIYKKNINININIHIYIIYKIINK